MLLSILSTLYILGPVMSRETMKYGKAMPIITHSLVNLGKMDVSFHFNSKDGSTKQKSVLEPSNSYMIPKPDIIAAPCPCSSVKNFNEPFTGGPSEILNKILMSNDLFSFNKETITSSLCCDSHEHIEDSNTVTFEFSPMETHANGQSPPLSLPSLVFDHLIPKRSAPVSSTPVKKAIEIFLFPKKGKNFFDLGKSPTLKDIKKKNNIKIVGDKKPKTNNVGELKNDFGDLKFEGTESVTTYSVKKDLINQDKENEKSTNKENNKITFATDSPNSLKY